MCISKIKENFVNIIYRNKYDRNLDYRIESEIINKECDKDTYCPLKMINRKIDLRPPYFHLEKWVNEVIRVIKKESRNDFYE